MAGLPGIDTIDTYGGLKINHHPVEDITTDLDADHHNLMSANIAGMTQTAVRAIRRFVGHATTPTDPVSGLVHAAVWGSDNGVKPTVTIGSTVYTITWPTSITDALGVSQNLNLRCACAQVETTGTTLYVATARVTAANVAQVRVYSSFAALDAAAGFNIVVWAW